MSVRWVVERLIIFAFVRFEELLELREVVVFDGWLLVFLFIVLVSRTAASAPLMHKKHAVINSISFFILVNMCI